MTNIVLELAGVTKQYGALRPLRVEHLAVTAGEHIAILGLDQPAAEVLIGLITGASLPDTGQVTVFGRSTADIADSDDWLTSLDRFGIVSQRAALLEPLSVVQNLALPFSLEIEPPPPDVAERAAQLAREVGLVDELLSESITALNAAGRMRIHLARALAFDPGVLLVEHPTATLAKHEVKALGQTIRTVATQRTAAVLTMTADVDYARVAADRPLRLDLATGRLTKL